MKTSVDPKKDPIRVKINSVYPYETDKPEWVDAFRSFCGCCGATFQKTSGPHSRVGARDGIRIIPGKRGKETNSDGNVVEHIETKNGWITICTRTEW